MTTLRHVVHRVDRSSVDLALLVVALVWGSSYLAAKDVTAVLSVPVVLALRSALTTAGLAALCGWRRVRCGVRPRPSAHLRTGVLLGATLAAVLALETYGVAHTSATNAGLIISLCVVLTPALDNAWSRCWLPARFFVATVVVVVGVALLVSRDGVLAPSWGDASMLAAAGLRAVHVTLIGRLTSGRDLDTTVLTTVQSATGTVLLCVVATPELLSTTAPGPVAWLLLLYLALACGVFAFVVQIWAVRRTSPGRASLLMGTEPVWAVAVGAALGGEALGVVGAVGAVLIVAGTYAGQLVEARHRAAVSATGPGAPATEARVLFAQGDRRAETTGAPADLSR